MCKMRIVLVFALLHCTLFMMSQELNPCGVSGVTIETTMFQYSPSTVFIDTGDTLSWINLQGLHNVNGEASSISGESFNNPEEFFFPSVAGNSDGACIGYHLFNIPGVYHYDCSNFGHAQAGMVGSVIVGDGGCMDPEADNYNELAEFDDESCCYLGELGFDVFPAHCFGELGVLQITTSSSSSLIFSIDSVAYSNSVGEFLLGPGSFHVIVQMSEGLCSDTLEVSMPQIPDEIELFATSTEASDESLGVGSATASGGTGNIEITWYDEAGEVADPNFLSEGNYLVEAIDSNGCVVSVNVPVYWNTIPQPGYGSSKLGAVVYPNPCKASFTVDGIKRPFSVRLFNALGEESDCLLRNTEREFAFRCSMPSGVYFIIVESEIGSSQVQPLVLH